MTWIWEHPDWPHLGYNPEKCAPFLAPFQTQTGVLAGMSLHLKNDDTDTVRVTLLCDEAVNTAAIEGDVLDRDSVQSSIQRQFGLATPFHPARAAERGMAELMVDVYQTYAHPLNTDMLFRWHRMIMSDRLDIRDIGAYRTHPEPMQIVSGATYAPDIHYEAPPASIIPDEMHRFISWYNDSEHTDLPPLLRAGIAHFYFECIHPFEDGNGRIGRALVEKTLAQGVGRPTLIAFARAIQTDKKAYYRALQLNSQVAPGTTTVDITDWLVYFAQTILKAQKITEQTITFVIAKTHFFDYFQGALNPRQEKVILRLFAQGPEGFKGGLSAEKYMKITGVSSATATRDLLDLVQKRALTRTGTGRYTRYGLDLSTAT